MKPSKVIALACAVAMLLTLFGCAVPATDTAAAAEPAAAGSTAADKEIVYYYVGINNNHPYWYDVHQGFEYAAKQLGVTVIRTGPDDWDPQGQAAALEQVITKKPDGIITPVFDASLLPGPTQLPPLHSVVAIESTMEGANVVSYIGLDNYDSGMKTPRSLWNTRGDTGKVVVMGNWGAANTDAKLKGFEDYLAANTTWEVIAKLDDKAVTETAIEQAKTAFNNYADMTAIVGLDSSSGAGIGSAMEELGRAPGSSLRSCMTASAHLSTSSPLPQLHAINKTASMPFLALLMLNGIVKDGMQTCRSPATTPRPRNAVRKSATMVLSLSRRTTLTTS